MKVLILGGTRFMGRRLGERLVADGVEVTLLNRGSGPAVHGTRALTGDRSRPDGLAALGDERFDAAVDLSSYAAAWTAAAAEALAGRVRHFVFVSSGAVYRPSPELPWPETAPIEPSPMWGDYAREKVASERLLQARHAAGDLGVTILRLPFVMGPGNYADRESFLLTRLAAGRPLLLPGGGGALNQYVHVDDVVEAMTAALSRPSVSAGRAFNVGWPGGVTNRGLAALCAELLGVTATTWAIDADALGVASPVVDLSDVVFPFPDEHYLLDVREIARVLGVEARFDHRRMLEDYARDWSTSGDRAIRTYERERRAFAALGQPLTEETDAKR